MKQRDDTNKQTNKQTQPAATDTHRQSRDLLKFIYRYNKKYNHLHTRYIYILVDNPIPNSMEIGTELCHTEECELQFIFQSQFLLLKLS